MNQMQTKHAMERAKAIYKMRAERIIERNTTPAVDLSKDEKLEALRSGKFTILDADRYRWFDNVKFTEELEAVFDKAKAEAETATLKADYNRLVDELILGDNQEALKLLRDFEASN